MRDVAIVSFSQLPSVRRDIDREIADLVFPVVHAAVKQSGIPRHDIGFTCSRFSLF